MYALLVLFGAGLGAVAPPFSLITIVRSGPVNATAIVGAFTVGQAARRFSAACCSTRNRADSRERIPAPTRQPIRRRPVERTRRRRGV
jgi:hypothetical protein